MSPRLSTMIIAVLPVLAACSSSRSDPMGADDTAGGLELPGIAARPNTEVDSTNLLEVFDQVTLEAYTASWDAAMALAKTQDLRLVNLRTLGDYSGYTVTSGSAVLSVDSLINDYSMTVTFKSFSITGSILLDGEVEIHSRMWQTAWGWYYGHPIFDGALDFKGDWKGRIEYDGLRLPVKPTGELVSAFDVENHIDSIPSDFYPKGKVKLMSDKGVFVAFIPFY